MVVLGFFAWSFIQCYWLLQKYFAYPMEVKLDLKASIELDFPSVTICNLNPIRHRSLKEEPFRTLEDIAEPDTEDVLYKATLNHWIFEEDCQTQNKYRCTNGQCLDILYVCNGEFNCMDGCDEQNCEHTVCNDSYFRCKSGRCIPSNWICDGTRDCQDNDDELSNCPTNSTDNTDTTSATNDQSAETSTNTPEYVTTTDTAAPSSTLTPKRLKRDTLSHQQKNSESDSEDIPRKLKKELQRLHYKIEEKMGKLDKEKIVEELYKSYMQYVNTKKLKEAKTRGDGEIFDHTRNKRDVRKTSANTTINWSTVLGNSNFTKWTMLDTNPSMQPSFYNMKDDEYVAAMTYAYITAQLDPTIVEKSGNVKEDFIASCRFGGYMCSPKNFTYFHNHKYGNCYTFNSGQQESTPTTKFPGPAYGLILELFINQGEYVANLAPEAGARVVIHKKGSFPFPEDEGIDVMPGRSTSIGIKQHSFSRLTPPHGECGDTPKTKDYYVEHLGTSLSKLSCLKSCYQDIIIDFCNCAVPFFFLVGNVTVCNMTNPVIEGCVDKLPEMAQDRYKLCDQLCPLPCQDTRYETTISQAVWPSEKYDSYLDKKLQQTNSLYMHIKSTSQEFTKIQIYFQDLIYQHVEQQEGYESMSLISDLGGQLGLWLGLSAITIGEFFSFLCSIGRSLPSACSGGKANTVQSLPNLQPATLEELYDDMYPEVSNYEPPDVTYPSKFQPDA